MNSSLRKVESEERNGLSRIKGMGAKSEEALRSVDVKNVTEVARFQSAADLHQHLVDHGVTNVPLGRIKQATKEHGDWITQAKRLQHQRAGFTVLVLEDEESEPPTWTIKTWHDEADREVSFDSSDSRSWANWLLGEADLPPIGALHVDEGVADAPRLVENRLDVVDLDVSKGSNHGGTADCLVASVVLRLRGPDAASITEHGLPFRLEFLARDEAVGTLVLLESADGRIGADEEGSSVECTIELPDVGQYRLLCAPVCGHAGITVRAVDGPRLSVIAGPVR